MRKIIRLALLVLPLVLPLVFPSSGVFGCGSTGGDDSSGGSDSIGTGSGVAITDTLTTLNSVLMVASTSLTVSAPFLILDGANGKTVEVDQHVHCSDGNQASSTGTNNTGLFDISIVMNGCEGVNGSSGFGGTSAVNENRDFTGDFTGSAGGNGCSVSLESLGYSFSTPVETITAPTSESVTGSISATCTETAGSALVSCDFSGVVDAQSSSALTAACTCTGDGCGS